MLMLNGYLIMRDNFKQKAEPTYAIKIPLLKHTLSLHLLHLVKGFFTFEIKKTQKRGCLMRSPKKTEKGRSQTRFFVVKLICENKNTTRK